MSLSKYLCYVSGLWEAGCRLHPLYRDATLQPHPPQTMCNYTNRSQNCFNQLNKKDNETEQEKDGLCAVSDFQT